MCECQELPESAYQEGGSFSTLFTGSCTGWVGEVSGPLALLHFISLEGTDFKICCLGWEGWGGHSLSGPPSEGRLCGGSRSLTVECGGRQQLGRASVLSFPPMAPAQDSFLSPASGVVSCGLVFGCSGFLGMSF